jgi:hypothetical protein
VSDLTVSEVLNQAADLIDAEGLWQGGCSATNSAGQCPITAIYEITEHDRLFGLHTPAVNALQASLGFDRVAQVYRWNDAAPSAEVVTSQLRRAAELAVEDEK